MNAATKDIKPVSELARIPLKDIYIRPGANPRRMKNAASRAEIKDSIASEGVMSSILVSPRENAPGYWLVFGHTRYELSEELNIPDIPAQIRKMTEQEMRVAALTENLRREDMTPVDEGAGAKELLISLKNDTEEALRILGWSPKKLQSRILLTHATDEVNQALCDRKIQLGHAELLCGLRAEAQGAALKRVIENNMTVSELKDKLQQATLLLSNAIFETADCNLCPHNSTTQASLFTTSMEKSRCMNPVCFQQKTETRLNAIRVELLETVPLVKRDNEVPSDSHITLHPSVVGEQQFTACQSCTHFGAVVKSTVGSAGQVIRSQCFNLHCHDEKKAQHKAELDAHKTNATKRRVTSEGSKGNETPAVTPKADTLANALVERHHAIHRQAAGSCVRESPLLAKAIAILSLMHDGRITPKKLPAGWPTSLSGKSRAIALSLLIKFPEDKLDALLVEMAARQVTTSNDMRTAQSPTEDTFGALAEMVCRLGEADLSKHFVIDADYLDLLTKGAIERLLIEAGFDDYYQKKKADTKAFKALFSLKKGELIKVIADAGFDFKGYVPCNLKLTQQK